MKLIAMPVVTLMAAKTVGLTGPALMVALLFQALPCATSAYITVRQLGGDAPLMAGITASQTLLATISIPLMMTALMSFGALYFYEQTGSYLIGWGMTIALGIVATLVHWPIDDRPVVRKPLKAAAA